MMVTVVVMMVVMVVCVGGGDRGPREFTFKRLIRLSDTVQISACSRMSSKFRLL